jgi:hypothetical protein
MREMEVRCELCDMSLTLFEKSVLSVSNWSFGRRLDPLRCDGQFMSMKIDGDLFLPHFNLRCPRHSL